MSPEKTPTSINIVINILSLDTDFNLIIKALALV